MTAAVATSAQGHTEVAELSATITALRAQLEGQAEELRAVRLQLRQVQESRQCTVRPLLSCSRCT